MQKKNRLRSGTPVVRKLITTMLILCLPVVAALFSYGTLFNSGAGAHGSVLGAAPAWAAPLASLSPRNLKSGASASSVLEPSAIVDVEIQGFAYSPDPLTIAVGTTVRWFQLDAGTNHSATSDPGAPVAFDTGRMPFNGQSAPVTFNTPGVYSYHCSVHGRSMTASIIVQSAPGETATSTIAVPTTAISTVAVPATATTTPNPIAFSDVPPGSPFYPFVSCLVSHNVLSGYMDGTFRPGVEVNRGQLAKIIANAAGFTEKVTSDPTFQDVDTDAPFYLYVERIASRHIISGYACGGAGEPCGAGDKPYFRPAANATRGQIAKIVASAAYLTTTPTSQTFADVPATNNFYSYVEQLAANNAMSGYSCGGAGEPCDANSRPYFRPAANTTRGQISKIVATPFFPDCAR